MVLDKWLCHWTIKKISKNDEVPLDVQVRLVCETVWSEVREIKTDIMKEVDDKFEHIINLIKKK